MIREFSASQKKPNPNLAPDDPKSSSVGWFELVLKPEEIILGGLLGVILGKLVQLILRQTKLLTVDYASLAVIFAFVFWSVFFGKP